MANTIQCPSCGAPTELRSRSIRLVVCAYCSSTIELTPTGLVENGKAAQLADLFTELATGAAGRIGSKSFAVAGRVRYTWSDGFWDEWSIALDDGTMAWLHEDEGELSMVAEVPVQGSIDFDSARVGEHMLINGERAYVHERRSAEIQGAEGQVPRGVFPGATLDYIDATVGKVHYMLERTQEGIELFVGEPVDDDAVEVY